MLYNEKPKTYWPTDSSVPLEVRGWEYPVEGSDLRTVRNQFYEGPINSIIKSKTRFITHANP
jgi:hypothetical protein